MLSHFNAADQESAKMKFFRQNQKRVEIEEAAAPPWWRVIMLARQARALLRAPGALRGGPGRPVARRFLASASSVDAERWRRPEGLDCVERRGATEAASRVFRGVVGGDGVPWIASRPQPSVRVLRALSSRARPRDPYELLGVAKGLTDREYKVAYLKQAKVWHPDLRPNDPEATRKFQELSAAYEQIKDSGARAAFDRSGPGNASGFGGGYGQHQGPFDPKQSAREAAATWAEAFDDAGALVQAGKVWWEDERAELDDDAHDFAMAISERRLGDAWVVAQKRSGLIVGVALPLLVVLRWPGAALAVLRGVAPLVTVVLGGVARVLVQNPRLLPVFTGLIRQFGGRYWTAAVQRARRTLRDKEKRDRARAAKDEDRRRAYAEEQYRRRQEAHARRKDGR